MSVREIESSVLSKSAAMLKNCQENWHHPDRDAKLDQALRYNQLLWTIFQAELAKADNPLQRELREDLLNLSAFIDKRTFEVMAYPSPEKLSILIEINLNIAAGLRGSPID
jgi:flagellar protein FlaF